MSTMRSLFKTQLMPDITSRLILAGLDKVNKRDGIVYKETDAGHVGISIRPIFYRPNILNIEVRCISSITYVQNLLIGIGFIESNSPSEITWTCGVNIGEISKGRYINWEIIGEDMQACASVAESIEDYATRFGLPYLSSRTSEEQVYTAAMANDRFSIIEFIIVEKKYLSAIALAHKLNRPDVIQKIVEDATEFFTKNRENDDDLNDFLNNYEKLQKILSMH